MLTSSRLLPMLLLFGLIAPAAGAQTTSTPPLTDYVGTYTDHPGDTVEIVAGEDLFAVQDEAKYHLRPSGADEFTTGAGGKISFPRDAAGKVTGYRQDGVLHPRVSLTVSPESAALAHPRPAGQDSPQAYRYHLPADLHDGLAVSDIAHSDLGVETANAIVRGVLDGTWKDVHSVLLFQHGHLVLEEYFYGYDAARPHQLRSATKSVVSTLAGIAIDRHALTGVDQTVLPSLPYTTYANPDPRKATITLGNLLSMSSGLDCNDHSATSPGRETVIDEAPDWVKATLDLPMINNPGSQAYYCSGGVAVVGRMVEDAVHMSLPDFAQASLFAPIGMKKTDWRWNYDLTNADKEYSQIYLRPRDMLKLGIVFSDDGKWNGHQVLSPSWVKASLATHSQVDETDYGYFWWHPWLNVKTPTGTQRVYLHAAQGNGGQKIYILPEYDFVAIFTAGDYNSNGAPPNRIMIEVILPKLLAAHAR